MQAGPNLMLCPDARSGGLWGAPGSSTLQLGKRTAGAQSSLEMQEDASESVSEQVGSPGSWYCGSTVEAAWLTAQCPTLQLSSTHPGLPEDALACPSMSGHGLQPEAYRVLLLCGPTLGLKV